MKYFPTLFLLFVLCFMIHKTRTIDEENTKYKDLMFNSVVESFLRTSNEYKNTDIDSFRLVIYKTKIIHTNLVERKGLVGLVTHKSNEMFIEIDKGLLLTYKGYRSVLYHEFGHAFFNKDHDDSNIENIMHTSYNINPTEPWIISLHNYYK